MFRFIIIISLLILSKTSFASPLNIHTSNWAPYFIENENRKGIIYEILEKCAVTMGFKTNFESLPINRMFLNLKNGKLDINVMSKRRGREKYVLYSKEPLFEATYIPFTLKGKDVQISKLSDFNLYRLGHFVGMRYSPEFLPYMKKRLSDETAETVNSQLQNIRKLLSGRIDVFIGESKDILWQANRINALDKIQALDYKIKTSPYYLTVSKNSKNIANPQLFLNGFDKCVSSLKKSGEISTIESRYVFEP